MENGFKRDGYWKKFIYVVVVGSLVGVALLSFSGCS
jgi:hypothetical protein